MSESWGENDQIVQTQKVASGKPAPITAINPTVQKAEVVQDDEDWGSNDEVVAKPSKGLNLNSAPDQPQAQAEPAAPEEKAPLDTKPEEATEDKRSTWQQIKDAVTGNDRETEESRNLDEYDSSILANSGISAGKLVKTIATLPFTLDPKEFGQILEHTSPFLKVSQDEKGNYIVSNTKTGIQQMINKPGLSAMDVQQGLDTTALFMSPVGRLKQGAGLLKTALAMGAKDGAIEAVNQGMQATSGGTFDVDDVALSAGTGAAGEVVAKGLSALGAGAKEALARRGNAAYDASTAKGVAQSNDVIGNIATASKKANTRNIDEVVANAAPRKDVIEAAEHLGLDPEVDLLPSHYSGNKSYREAEQGIKSAVGSSLNAQEFAGIAKVREQADKIITDFGGDLDKVKVSDDFRTQAVASTQALGKSANSLYDQVSNTIPAKTKVDMQETLDFIKNRLDELGDKSLLSSAERQILTVADSGKPVTYAAMDELRKQVGDGMRNAGVFADSRDGLLKKLYGTMSTDQQVVADQFGIGDIYTQAKDLVSKRKNIEEKLVNVIGKDLSGAVVPKVSSAIRGLGASNFQSFDKTMAGIPESMRPGIIMTSLNGVFSKGGTDMDMPHFVKWYASMERSPEAMKRLNQYVPEEAQARMKSLYTLTDGIYEGQKDRITTGKIESVIKDLAGRNGAMSKLYGGGVLTAKAAAAEVPGLFFGIPGVGATAVLTRAISAKQASKGISGVKEADAMLSSPKYRASLIAYAKSDGKSTAATQAADLAMKKAPVYQKWLSTVDEGVRERIATVGPTNYFFHDNSYDKPTEPDPVSMDDIRATAKQYGVSEQKVIDHVKANGGKIQ